MIEGLNPCPNCGSTDLVTDVIDTGRNLRRCLHYHCADCEVEYYTQNEKAVAAAWPAWIKSVTEARVPVTETGGAAAAGTGRKRPRRAAPSSFCPGPRRAHTGVRSGI